MTASSPSQIKGITESAQTLAKKVLADQEECSITFSEFLTLNGNQKTANTFTDVFLMTFDMFDHQKKGKIPEMVFRNCDQEVCGRYSRDRGDARRVQ